MQIQIPITAEISRNSRTVQYIPIGQGDNAYRFLVSLKNSGVAVEIPDGATVVLNCLKPDGTYTETVGSVKDGTAVFDIASNTVAVPGTVICEMQIFDGTQLTAQKFELRVEPNIINDDVIESTDDYGFIRILVSELPNKVDKVEGKGLSTNDYSDFDKTEVAKINDKANASDVYTKTETDSAIKRAITAYDTANMQLLGVDS